MRAMNKLMMYCLSATLMLSMAIFSGCGDDDDGPAALPLEGTLWTETKSVSENCDDPDDNENYTSTCTETECYTLVLEGGTITFYDLEDGTLDTSTGTYTISGSTIKVTTDGFQVDVGFSISGTTLTINLTEPFGGCEVTVTYVGVPAG